MPNREFLNYEFDILTVDKCTSDTAGKLAYGYYRPVVLKQSEDRSTEVRHQITHIQEAAVRQGYCIPWELLYFVVHSGFDFENRRAQTQSYAAISSVPGRADAIIIENLERLSRFHWHRDFLLDEFAAKGIEVVFWKEVILPVEQLVMNVLAQKKIRRAFEQQRENNLGIFKSPPQCKDFASEQEDDSHGK